MTGHEYEQLQKELDEKKEEVRLLKEMIAYQWDQLEFYQRYFRRQSHSLPRLLATSKMPLVTLVLGAIFDTMTNMLRKMAKALHTIWSRTP